MLPSEGLLRNTAILRSQGTRQDMQSPGYSRRRISKHPQSRKAHSRAPTTTTAPTPTSTSRQRTPIPSRYPPTFSFAGTFFAKMAAAQSVQCFGKKKTATAVAHCKQGKGLIKVNGQPLGLVEPQVLRFKVYEPVLILGLDKFGMSS